MRLKIAGVVAALATTFAAAPAMACYTGCASNNYLVGNFSHGCSGYYGGCGVASVGVREQLSNPERYQSYDGPQYYYVNQGPTYTGPGAVAPAPTYQERAVSGWYSYSRPYYYGYYGGPYANSTSHYYDGASLQGPAIATYRWHRGHRVNYRDHRGPRPRYYYTSRTLRRVY